MNRIVLLLFTLTIYCSCKPPIKTKEVYNDHKGLSVKVFVPDDWVKYDSILLFLDEERIHNVYMGPKDSAMWMEVEVYDYKDNSDKDMTADSLLVWRRLRMKATNPGAVMIYDKVYKNADGKRIGELYFTDQFETFKGHCKLIIFSKGKKAVLITLFGRKKIDEFLRVSEKVENSLSF
jgi:hypothetical protein